MEKQVFGEKRRDDHTHAVVHPPGMPEFTHAGVYERIAGLALLPGPEKF